MKIFYLKEIKKYYGSKLALDIDELSLLKGEITGIFGPNGSGKSTLLRILAFLEYPTQGVIYFKGERIREFTLEMRRKVTLLDQSPYLLKRSVFENIAYGLKIRGIERNRIKKRVVEVLKAVGLEPDEYMSRKWYQLSGGEAQRVSLAARLVFKPEVLLLDEPTSNLDEQSVQLITQATLFARDKWDTTIVLVSHDREWLEGICDKIFRIRMGKLVK